ncbi:MAG: adenylyltransferase/cytidyltransferase family protein, partial [Gemmatimonadetes bacterium]|nr:adenylyltransferase/cytidyltransferase family protein [Gemmatimonadota bacterium]
MNRVAVYPGSFDPVTRGHEDLVRRCRGFADRVIVAVAKDSAKTPLFTAEERIALLRAVVGSEPGVEVEGFDGLLVDFARRVGA